MVKAQGFYNGRWCPLPVPPKADAAAKPYETLTDEGLLSYGVFYTRNLAPSQEREKKLVAIRAVGKRLAFYLKELSVLEETLQTRYGGAAVVDEQSLRVLTTTALLQAFEKEVKRRDTEALSLAARVHYGWEEAYPNRERTVMESDLLG